MNYQSVTKLSLCIVFIFAIFCTTSNAAQSNSKKAKITGEPEALKILEQFRANENASQAISCSFISEHIYQEIIEEIPMPDGSITAVKKNAPQITRIISTWAIKGDLIRFSSDMTDENDVSIGQYYIASWDGTQGTVYKPSKSYTTYYSKKSKLLEEYSAEDPRGFSFFEYTMNALLDKAGGEFKIRRENSDGKELVILTQKTSSRTYEYWLDPANRYVPIKIIDNINGNNKLLREVIVNDYKILEDGSWFITKSTITYPGLKRKIIFNTKNVSFEEKPDDFFKIKIPEGTLVDDTITGNYYHAKPAIPSLVGKSLPDTKNISADFNPELIKENSVLVCFFDIEQRPSRNCILELSKKAQEIKEKDVEIISVHASKIDQKNLDEWAKENNISFPIGMIQENVEQTKSNWGVKALPWLIFTDKEHIVQAEGFSIGELDEKIN